MNSEDYLGSVGLSAFTYAPLNTALCQGQTVQIQQNTALYSLMGIGFGGNGTSTFALPDLRGAVPIGAGVTPGENVEYFTGERIETLTEQRWSRGAPAAAQPGEATTLPIAEGPAGIALNWAIALYGVFPPRGDW